MINYGEIQAISQFLKVMSDATRLTILYLLKEKERTVSEIIEFTGGEQSAISHQLSILKKARLVRSHREGRYVIYTLDDEHVFDVLQQVRTHINEQ